MESFNNLPHKIFSIREGYERVLRDKMLYVDLGISKEVLASVQKFLIEKPIHLTFIGDGGMDFKDKLGSLLSVVGQNSQSEVEKVTNVICSIFNTVLKDADATEGEIMVRVTLPDNDFVVPRWHTDGAYQINGKRETRKLVTTLKGPSTRFARTIDKQRFEDAERDLGIAIGIADGDLDDLQVLQLRSSMVHLVEEIASPKLGEAMIYEVGLIGEGVHSEPDSSESDGRIFISVVPASKKE